MPRMGKGWRCRGSVLRQEKTLTKHWADRVPTECEDLYSKFFTAFGEMAPCDVSMKNYEPYMDAARQDLPQDKVLLEIVFRSMSRSVFELGLCSGPGRSNSSLISTWTLITLNFP